MPAASRGSLALTRVLVVAVAALLAISSAAPGVSGDHTFNLLYLGSAKEQLLERHIGGGAMAGGVARLKTKVEDLKAASGAPGSFVQVITNMLGPSLFGQLYNGRHTREVLYDMGFRVTALGVDDFFRGVDAMTAHALAWDALAVDTSLLATNVDFLNDPDDAVGAATTRWAAVPVRTVEGAQVLVGVVSAVDSGLCELTVCTSRAVEARLADVVERVNAAAADARAAGAVTVIMLATPLKLAQLETVVAGLHGVALVVSTELFLPLFPGDLIDLRAGGPHMGSLADADGRAVFMVGAGDRMTILGHVTVTVGTEHGFLSGPAPGADTRVDSALHVLFSCANADNSTCVERDAVMEVRENIVELELSSWANSKVGEAAEEVFWLSQRCRFEQCAMGSVVADAVRWKMADLCDVALFGSGAIRAGLAEGDISVANTRSVVPFNGPVSSFQLEGRHLVETIAHAIDLVPANASLVGGAASIRGSGRFLHASGLRFQFNPTMRAGAKLVSLETLEGTDGGGEKFVPVQSGAIYRVCAPRFLRLGGDGFEMLNRTAINPKDYGPTSQTILVDYISEVNKVTAPQDTRIVVTRSAESFYLCTKGCVVGQGVCVAWDVCACEDGFDGSDCSTELTSIQRYVMVVAIVAAFAVTVGAVYTYVHYSRKRQGLETSFLAMLQLALAFILNVKSAITALKAIMEPIDLITDYFAMFTLLARPVDDQHGLGWYFIVFLGIATVVSIAATYVYVRLMTQHAKRRKLRKGAKSNRVGVVPVQPDVADAKQEAGVEIDIELESLHGADVTASSPTDAAEAAAQARLHCMTEAQRQDACDVENWATEPARSPRVKPRPSASSQHSRAQVAAGMPLNSFGGHKLGPGVPEPRSSVTSIAFDGADRDNTLQALASLGMAGGKGGGGDDGTPEALLEYFEEMIWELEHRMMLQLVNLPLLLLEDVPLFGINLALLIKDDEIETAFLVSMLVNAGLMGVRISELSQISWLMSIRKTLRKLTRRSC